MNKIDRYCFSPITIKNRFFSLETSNIENVLYFFGIAISLDLMLQGGFFISVVPLTITLFTRFIFNTFRRWDNEILDEPDYYKSESRLEWEREVVAKRDGV